MSSLFSVTIISFTETSLCIVSGGGVVQSNFHSSECTKPNATGALSGLYVVTHSMHKANQLRWWQNCKQHLGLTSFYCKADNSHSPVFLLHCMLFWMSFVDTTPVLALPLSYDLFLWLYDCPMPSRGSINCVCLYLLLEIKVTSRIMRLTFCIDEERNWLARLVLIFLA